MIKEQLRWQDKVLIVASNSHAAEAQQTGKNAEHAVRIIR
jgi:hypothetical protein